MHTPNARRRLAVSLSTLAFLTALAADRAVARPAGVTARTPIVPSAVVPTPSPNPLLRETVVPQVFVAGPPPLHLRPVTGPGDCAGHVVITHVFSDSCTAKIVTGALLLIWDAPSGLTPNAYRLYAVDRAGGSPSLAASVLLEGETYVAVPYPPGGFNGHCYALSAVTKNGESARGNVYCASAGDYTTTTILPAIATRTSFREHTQNTHASGDDLGGKLGVGYAYGATKSTFYDTADNIYHRAGFAFDVTPMLHRRLVSARLRLTIETSSGAGNNHSCANGVATGTEFWWNSPPGGWLDADFSNPVTIGDTGPEVSADVTSLVAPWLAGQPNYGLILRNAYEDSNAFLNAQCETTYVSPLLELHYY